jgi:hypothetical protein
MGLTIKKLIWGAVFVGTIASVFWIGPSVLWYA